MSSILLNSDSISPVCMANHYDSTGKLINLYGSSNHFPQLSKESFLKNLEQSNYHEITDAELHDRSLSFTLQVNGESYEGHALISKQYAELDRLFRKAQVSDFKEVSIFRKKNILPFHFQLTPPENQQINSIFEKVLKIIDSDGDVLCSSTNKSPDQPSPNSGIKRQEATRSNNRRLHLSLSA